MPRSGECYACKRSKTKCDSGFPQCLRCIKTGKTCPGYRSETELAFRDMTWLTEKKVESHVQNILRARSRAKQGIKRVCAIKDWREKAVTRFFADYILDSDAVPHTTIVFPGLCSSSDAGPCLKDALHAAALANQANQLGLKWMAIEANEAYGRALASLTSALQDLVKALKDSTLATAFLVSLYEGISGYLPTGVLMDHHHHRGRTSLLRLRTSDQFKSPIGRCLFGVMHEQAIIKCLTRHEKPMEEAGAWIQDFGTKGPPQEIAALNVSTAQICAEAQILFDSSKNDKDWQHGLVKIIDDATTTDLRYQGWIDMYSISEVWRYQTSYLSPNQALPTGRMVQVHHDFWTAYIWTSCRSKRAHLHEVSLHCLSLLGCYPEAKDLCSKLRSLDLDENLLTRSKRIVEDMVSGICATVPFMLGDIDSVGKFALEKKRMPLAGYKLLWPLHVAKASVDEGSETEAWIRGRLEFIDSKMGIRFGGLLARRIKKEPWNLS